MREERRKHQRLARPFDGSFGRASGSATRCRISDISLGGCFVESLSPPIPGSATVINIMIGSHTLSFAGRVVYTDATMGFAVEFRDISSEELAELARLLDALDVSEPSA